MLKLVPQLFYDLLARVVPGVVLLISSTFVVLGASRACNIFIAPSEQKNAFGLGTLLVLLLGSYLVGLIFGQLWEMSLGHITKMRQEQIEAKCQEDRLVEHNRFQEVFGGKALRIESKALPKTFIMRDHLRYFAPSEAARLLKIRAERRMCQVLIVGFSILAVVNLAYLVPLTLQRVLFELFLVTAISAFWRMSFRLHRYLANGTMTAWLVQASLGRIPLKANSTYIVGDVDGEPEEEGPTS